MSKVEIIPFDVSHFDAMDLRNDPGLDDFFRVPDYKFYLARVANHPAYTVMADGKPVACGGAIILWPGVGEAWAFIGKDISRGKFSFVRAAFRRLSEIQARYNLHRLQATVHEEHAAGHQFLFHLGFKPEGRLIGYGADESNYVMYSRRSG